MSHIHNRRSLRLPHYDYSRAGYYFVIIATHKREHLFGEIVDGVMVLNVAGEMVEEWYNKLEDKFPNIINHDMVIMPNHIHFVIEIAERTKWDRIVMGIDADRKGRHMGLPLRNKHTKPPVGADPCVCLSNTTTVGYILQWFKTMTTNKFIQMVKNNIVPPFDKRIWQRNFYEHVIRDDNDHSRIAEYI